MTDTPARTVTVQLANPLQLANGTATELTIREPSIGALVQAEELHKTPLAQSFSVLASMCGITFAEFEAIPMSDFRTIQAAAEPLLGNVLAGEDGAS